MVNFKGELIKCPECGESEGVSLYADARLEIVPGEGLKLANAWGDELKFDCSECDHEWDWDQERDGS